MASRVKPFRPSINDAYSEYQEQLDSIEGSETRSESGDNFGLVADSSRYSIGPQASEIDGLGEDVDPLLGPGTDAEVNRMNRALERQQRHFNFRCTWRTLMCVGILSIIDFIVLMVEFGLNRGWTPGTWWGNISADVLMKMGAKDTELIQKGQVWRLFTAMFLHVGLLHCLLNVLTQLSLSVQIESSIGAWRTGFIYILSGIGGNLTSAVFLPNLPEVGASSSLFGLVAVYFVDLIVNWSLHTNRTRNLIVLTVTTVISFALGFFPHIDNFAHLGGFFTGLIAAFIVMPSVELPSLMPSRSRKQFRRKMLRVVTATVILLLLFIVGFVILFSGLHLDHWCGFCEWISCLPIFQVCKVVAPTNRR